ncbi:MAG: hypothetical protein U0X39_16330 [Bacteroidales bacterium]
MAVDTHVFRVSRRIRLRQGSQNSAGGRKTINEEYPPELMHKAHHWLILHGRYVAGKKAGLPVLWINGTLCIL